MRKILKFFGLYTTKDIVKYSETAYILGKITLIRELKDFADGLNGNSAEDWSKAMYDKIKSTHESMLKK